MKQDDSENFIEIINLKPFFNFDLFANFWNVSQSAKEWMLQPWLTPDGQVAGFRKNYTDKMRFMTVRAASHSVVESKPAAALEVLKHLLDLWSKHSIQDWLLFRQQVEDTFASFHFGWRMNTEYNKYMLTTLLLKLPNIQCTRVQIHRSQSIFHR